MLTLPMITERLNEFEITRQLFLPDDAVSSVRAGTEAIRLQKQILYVFAGEKGGFSVCRTAAGSSFGINADLLTAVNAILDVFEYYALWEEELCAACRRGCTLSEMLEISRDHIVHPVFILDSNQWPIAHSPAFEQGEIDDAWASVLESDGVAPSRIAEYNSRYFDFFQRKKLYRIPGAVFSHEGYAFNLFQDQTFCGVMILIEYGTAATQGALDAFLILAEHILTLINAPSSIRSFSLPERPFSDYLSEPTDATYERLIRTLRISLWKDDDPKLLIYATPMASSHLAPNPFHTKLMFSRMDGILVASQQNGMTLLCNMRMLKEAMFMQHLSQWLSQVSYCSGVSGSFTALTDIHKLFRQSYIALKFGRQEAGAVNRFEPHILKYLISILQREDAALLRHPCLDVLREYDRRHGSKLYDTLFVYLKNERRILETAAELNVHRSTLIHRLQRLDELLSDTLEPSEVRVHILLSYLAERDS